RRARGAHDGGVSMLPRGSCVLFALLFCACSPSRPPLPQSPPPAAPPAPVAPEACSPDAPYGPLPSEVDGVYDTSPDPSDPYADESPYDPDDAEEAAKLAYFAGRKADSEERWEDAYSRFLESWSYSKRAVTAIGLAKETLRLGRPSEALFYLEFLDR